MELSFYKYQGTGNDFVMVDNRWNVLSKNDTNLIKRLCDRKFGIGADGLILLEKPEAENEDFRMLYFNADGKESSMCGNGGRCIAAFAHMLEVVKDKASFSAIDGFHRANIYERNQIGLEMQEVQEVKLEDGYVFLDTGSPHHVIFCEEVDTVNVKDAGASIRNSHLYRERGGTNVNFVQILDEQTLKVRTFERGVEDETLSCGTGVTAAAIAAHATGRINSSEAGISTLGGNLKVSFQKKGEVYTEIWLTGPAKPVFKGVIKC